MSTVVDGPGEDGREDGVWKRGGWKSGGVSCGVGGSRGSSRRVTVPTMPMSRDEDLEWPAEERAVRDFSDLADEGGWGFFGVVGEWDEEEKEGEQGEEGMADEISYKESWFVVSCGATSAEPEAANCALTAASDNGPPRPGDGDGNGELMTSAP